MTSNTVNFQLGEIMTREGIRVRQLHAVTGIHEKSLRHYRAMDGCPLMTVKTLCRLSDGLNQLSGKKITPSHLLGLK